MIADIRFWEQKASEGHYAIPHFNVWNAEMLMGVIDAAEELRAPIIISFGTGFTGNTSFEDFCYMMESMAKKATVPVILHWDHGRNWTILKNAVDHCMNSVMRDASALPYEENVAEIKRCVDYFHAYNIPVEAELGHVGNETVYEEALAEYAYTDPSQAKDFVERTGCDSLAIAIGTSHGAYKFKGEAKLRFDILAKIKEKIPNTPIVLHGASTVIPELVEICNKYGADLPGAKGVPDEILHEASVSGVSKINVDTDLRLAMTAGIRETFVENPSVFDPRKYMGKGRDLIEETVAHKIREVFGSSNKA